MLGSRGQKSFCRGSLAFCSLRGASKKPPNRQLEVDLSFICRETRCFVFSFLSFFICDIYAKHFDFYFQNILFQIWVKFIDKSLHYSAAIWNILPLVFFGHSSSAECGQELIASSCQQMCWHQLKVVTELLFTCFP